MITALILAAGQSKRMGQPKMLLPWGKTTVLKQVITTFETAGVEDILVVTGAFRKEIEKQIGSSARRVHNAGFAQGEMLSSVQVGLKAASGEAVLIALGDQPQVQVRSVQRLLEAYRLQRASILIPSFENRRGHPWLVTNEHWGTILEIKAPASLRDFLAAQEKCIQYVTVDDPGILQDLDTFEEYLKSKP